MLTIFLDYPPSVNRAWRQYNGKIYQPKEVVNYKLLSGWEAKKAGAKVSDNEIEVRMILHQKKKKKGLPSKNRVDLDNVCKVVLDSLNKVCYRDDKQVTKIVLEVGEAVKDGGITVTINER